MEENKSNYYLGEQGSICDILKEKSFFSVQDAIQAIYEDCVKAAEEKKYRAYHRFIVRSPEALKTYKDAIQALSQTDPGLRIQPQHVGTSFDGIIIKWG